MMSNPVTDIDVLIAGAALLDCFSRIVCSPSSPLSARRTDSRSVRPLQRPSPSFPAPWRSSTWRASSLRSSTRQSRDVGLSRHSRSHLGPHAIRPGGEPVLVRRHGPPGCHRETPRRAIAPQRRQRRVQCSFVSAVEGSDLVTVTLGKSPAHQTARLVRVGYDRAHARSTIVNLPLRRQLPRLLPPGRHRFQRRPSRRSVATVPVELGPVAISPSAPSAAGSSPPSKGGQRTLSRPRAQGARPTRPHGSIVLALFTGVTTSASITSAASYISAACSWRYCSHQRQSFQSRDGHRFAPISGTLSGSSTSSCAAVATKITTISLHRRTSPCIKHVIETTDFLTEAMEHPRLAQHLRNVVIPPWSRVYAHFRHAFVQRLSELGIAYAGSPIVEAASDTSMNRSTTVMETHGPTSSLSTTMQIPRLTWRSRLSE